MAAMAWCVSAYSSGNRSRSPDTLIMIHWGIRFESFKSVHVKSKNYKKEGDIADNGRALASRYQPREPYYFAPDGDGT